MRVEGETTNQIVAGRQTIFHYGLATSAIYTVSVAAVNSAGTGIYSDEIVLGTGDSSVILLYLYNYLRFPYRSTNTLNSLLV